MSADQTSIARLARPMSWVLTAGLWLLPPLLVLFVLLFPGMIGNHPAIASSHIDTAHLSGAATAAVIAALLIASAPTLWGLWELKRLFEGYAGGAIFTVGAARRLRRCGYAVLVSAAKTAVAAVLLSLALSIDLPEGRRILAVGLSSDDLAWLLTGGILLVIARVMEEGARLAEENAGFI